MRKEIHLQRECFGGRYVRMHECNVAICTPRTNLSMRARSRYTKSLDMYRTRWRTPRFCATIATQYATQSTHVPCVYFAMFSSPRPNPPSTCRYKEDGCACHSHTCINRRHTINGYSIRSTHRHSRPGSYTVSENV